MSTDGRLTRALGTRDLAVYYLSSLVGVGVLVVPGIALAKAGPASLLAWVILSVASLPIAVTFARFSARYPSAGGVSFLVRQAFGWRPGTAIGLFLLFLNLSTNPILGLAAARYLAALFGWDGKGAVAAGRVRGDERRRADQPARHRARLAGAVRAGGHAGGESGHGGAGVVAGGSDPDRLTPLRPTAGGRSATAIVVCFFSFFGWENAGARGRGGPRPAAQLPAGGADRRLGAGAALHRAWRWRWC